MAFLLNNDQDGFNSYISRDEFFNAAANINVPPPPPPPINDCPCEYTINGCTDSNANNYSPGANNDDGSCTYTGFCYPQGCQGVGMPMPGSNFTTLTSQGNCGSLGNYSNSPASCGSVRGRNSIGFDGESYSNFNQKGSGGYNDQMWFKD